MMDAPLVSVVIPAYNSARTVEKAVASALEQTFDDIEVIVVDDGSTDGTAGVIQRIDDDRVRLVSRPNGGAAAARNTGIEASVGTYVALLDADDLWVSAKLERQLAVLENRPGVHAVQCGAFFVDDELQLLSVERCRPSRDALLETLQFENLPATMSTFVIRREMFEAMGTFDTSLVILEEWDMAIKVSRHCNLVSIEEPLVLYRVHPGNRSRDVDIHIDPGQRILARLFDDPDLPQSVRAHKRMIYGRFYTSLAGGALRAKRWRQAATWGATAVRSHPGTAAYFAAMPLRRARRRLSRRSTTVPPLLKKDVMS